VTARTKRRTSYRACSCCSSIVAGGGGGILGGVGNRAHARAELQLVVGI